MNKPVYIFAGLTAKSVEDIADQIKKAKQAVPSDDGVLLVFAETLPEWGKRVTAEEIVEITFAGFIQDIMKVGKSAS